METEFAMSPRKKMNQQYKKGGIEDKSFRGHKEERKRKGMWIQLKKYLLRTFRVTASLNR